MSLLILIDGGYLKAMAKIAHARANFKEFPRWVLEQVQQRNQGQPRSLLRTIYYDCAPYQSNPPTAEERSRYQGFTRFRNFLENLPKFEVRLGRLVKRYREDGTSYFEQKRVDVLLAIDLVYYALSGHVSDIALVAGDADFVPAVQRAKEAGVRIWLFYGSRNAMSSDLHRLADDRIPLLDKNQRALFPKL